MGNVTPGALFRLPDGTTGIVEIVGGTVIGRNWHDGGLRRFEYHANTIDRHIICEPGDGPIRGNDKALADAQARVVRIEAERDAAMANANRLLQERDDVVKQWNETGAELHSDLRAEARRLTDLLDAVTHERDALRVEFKADHEALVAKIAAVTHERDALIRDVKSLSEDQDELCRFRDTLLREREELVAKIAAFEDACGLVDADGAPVDYDLSTLTFRRVGGDAVDHPSHYTATEFEPVVVIEALAPHYHVGAAIKYLARAPHKGRLAEDLRKARWYLMRAVAIGAGRILHPSWEEIAGMWANGYPERDFDDDSDFDLRKSAHFAIEHVLRGNYMSAADHVKDALKAIGGDACTG